MTLTIDDAANGGSEPGAWARAILHTPHLAANIHEPAAGGPAPFGLPVGAGGANGADPQPSRSPRRDGAA